jgi:C_GCAxxG_C_C family probable redox protein
VTQSACAECEERAVVALVAPTTMPTFSSAKAARAANEAASCYDEGYFCGEAVLKVVNSLAPDPLPPSLMRLGSGFCEGMGGAGCTCGAIAGGVMAIGLLAGRESASEPWEPSFHPSRALHDRFRMAFRASCCRTIVRPFGGMEGAGRHEHCAVMTGAATGWVVEIAEENGWL